MFECKLPNCKFKAGSPQLYASHCLQFHNTGPKIRFVCGIRHCSRTFTLYSSFKTHVFRNHSTNTNNQRTTNNSLPPTKPDIELICSLCNNRFTAIRELVAHTKQHFNGTNVIACPFPNCMKKYTILSSFTSHISKYHKQETNVYDTAATHDSLICDASRDVEVLPDEEAHSSLQCPDDTIVVDNLNDGSTSATDYQNTNNDQEQLVDNLARFFLTLEKKNHVPERTSQIIYNHFSSLINLTSDQLISSLTETLSEYVPETVLRSIIDSVFKKVLQTYSVDGPLRSIYCRGQYYRNRFKFVEPVAVRLGFNECNKECFMHYVPLEDSLQALLEDSTVYEQYQRNINSNQNHSNDSYQDFQDGQYMKSHPLFSKDKSLLQIILYQDEFLVANPLGSSRKDLKMFGVYYTLGNIHAWNRSKVDPFQLVLLCKSTNLKYFGQQLIFQRLIKSLQHVQQTGIEVMNKNIKGVLAYIVGDNLGSHYIGGYVENFSSATYFCQYCTITRREFMVEGIMTGQARTEETYNEAVTAVNRDNIESYEGIKFDSSFNILKPFHVVNGLPPCLGHDIFEGIAQYDIPLALEYFEQKKWITCEELNRKINTYDISFIGSKDKPCPVTCIGRGNKKLGGHAVQTWSLLRALPILIGDKIKDKEDLVWQMILLLISAVQIICSPCLNTDLIAILRGTIEEYIEMRRLLFPNTPLRPKHHYLCHYAEFVVKHGPLIRLWTLRFESKHKYFKEALRSAKNTKNVTKTLSVKHQLLQADYFSSYGLFPKEVAMEKATIYYPTNYPEKVNHAVMNNSRLRLYTELLIACQCLFRGTTYKKGDIVVISHDIVASLLRIELIFLKDGSDIFFWGTIAQGHIIEDMQIVEIEDTTEKTCYSILSLGDFQPYTPITGRGGNEVIVLKHVTGQ